MITETLPVCAGCGNWDTINHDGYCPVCSDAIEIKQYLTNKGE